MVFVDHSTLDFKLLGCPTSINFLAGFLQYGVCWGDSRCACFPLLYIFLPSSSELELVPLPNIPPYIMCSMTDRMYIGNNSNRLLDSKRLFTRTTYAKQTGTYIYTFSTGNTSLTQAPKQTHSIGLFPTSHLERPLSQPSGARNKFCAASSLFQGSQEGKLCTVCEDRCVRPLGSLWIPWESLT